jgi:hypothetical protein
VPPAGHAFARFAAAQADSQNHRQTYRMITASATSPFIDR